MRYLYVLLFFVFQDVSAKIQFSEDAEWYLITTTFGKHIDQSWGHSALWYVDEALGIDYVFEYASREQNNFQSTFKMLYGEDWYQLRATDFKTYSKEALLAQQKVVCSLISHCHQDIQQSFNGMLKELLSNTLHRYSLTQITCSSLLSKHIYPFIKQDTVTDISKTYREVYRSSSNLSVLEGFFVFNVLASSKADLLNEQNLPLSPVGLKNKIEQKKPAKIWARKKMNYRFILGILGCILVMLWHSPKWYLYSFFTLFGVLGLFLASIYIFSEELLFKDNTLAFIISPVLILGVFFLKKDWHKALLIIQLVFFLSLLCHLWTLEQRTLGFILCVGLVALNVIATTNIFSFKTKYQLNIQS